MRHTRLNCLVEKILAANPDVITIDANTNFNVIKNYTIFSDSDEEHKYTTITEEICMFNLQMCAKIMNNGLHFLIFIAPNLHCQRFELHVTLKLFNEQCNELIKLYENCRDNGEPIPLMTPLPHSKRPVLDMLRQGVLLYLDELINCFKVDQGRNISPDLIELIFELLKVASEADKRIASILIENFDRIQSILLSLLTLLSADTIHSPLRFWDSLEVPIRDVLHLVESLLQSLDSFELRESSASRGRKLKFRKHSTTPSLSKIFTLMSPVILKIFRLRHKHPVIYFLASTVFSGMSNPWFIWLVPKEVLEATFFTNEHIEEYISIFKEAENVEVYTMKKAGHCLAQIQNGEDGDNLQDDNCQSESKVLILNVLGNLCERSYEKSAEQIILAKWLVSIFLDKDLLKVILESNGKIYDKFTAHLLQELSREKICRNFLYENEGKDIIMQLLKSDNPVLAFESFLLLNRLCWDAQWREFIEKMEPKIEKYVCKWICSVANSIERNAQAKISVVEITRVISFQRPWRKDNPSDSIPLTEEEKCIPQSTQYCSIYPDLRNINMLKNGSIELLLTRIIQFCSNIHRLKFSDEFVSRFASISLLELLTIFYDWPSHCSFHVDLVIPNYCSCGDFKPSSFSNPSLFVERLCRNFDYEMELSIKKDEHFEGPFSCMSLSTKLLTWLIVDAKNKNSEWYSIVNTIAKKELGWKLNCFGEFLTDTISEGHVLSEEEILQMRENHDENLKIVNVPDLRLYCMNPACQYHSDYKEDLKMKVCSRCQSAYYCSPECQRSHWKIHKHHCTA